MKAFLLIFSMSLFTQAFSQQEYFVFLQTGNGQPFYVRMGEKTYSSSGSGYLILSKLKDSTYGFVIGFPQNQFLEQDFSLHVKKDRGFEVKNLNDKGWALLDLQTMELINASKPAGSSSGGASYNMVKRNDDFARLMAGVVNDTAVLYNVVMAAPVATTKPDKPVPLADTLKTEVVKTEEPKTVAPKAEASKVDKPKTEAPKVEEPKIETQKAEEPKIEMHTDTVAKSKPVEPEPIKDSVFNPPALPVIQIIKEYATDTGYHMIVLDDKKDSINIFIPADEKPAVEKPAVEKPVVEKPVVEKPVEIKTVDSAKTDTVVNQTPPPVEAIMDTSKNQSKLVMMNSDCRNFATSNDVDKLRVKLISEKETGARIAAVKKAFKAKCYSAQQIKALSEMFPYDEDKYHFFETAYPFVSDTGNFKALVSLLTDPVYVQRFRKLVRLD